MITISDTNIPIKFKLPYKKDLLKDQIFLLKSLTNDFNGENYYYLQESLLIFVDEVETERGYTYQISDFETLFAQPIDNFKTGLSMLEFVFKLPENDVNYNVILNYSPADSALIINEDSVYY